MRLDSAALSVQLCTLEGDLGNGGDVPLGSLIAHKTKGQTAVQTGQLLVGTLKCLCWSVFQVEPYWEHRALWGCLAGEDQLRDHVGHQGGHTPRPVFVVGALASSPLPVITNMGPKAQPGPHSLTRF